MSRPIRRASIAATMVRRDHLAVVEHHPRARAGGRCPGLGDGAGCPVPPATAPPWGRRYHARAHGSARHASRRVIRSEHAAAHQRPRPDEAIRRRSPPSTASTSTSRPARRSASSGPNGAGKTSTMRMIGCVSPASDGTLRVLGMDPARDGPRIRARLGVVPQQDTLDIELTVRENLVIYGRYFDLPYREAGRAGGRAARLRAARPTVPASRSSRCRAA